MVDIVDIYKSLKFSIGTVMKNPAQQMFDKAILVIGETLNSVPECYKKSRNVYQSS